MHTLWFEEVWQWMQNAWQQLVLWLALFLEKGFIAVAIAAVALCAVMLLAWLIQRAVRPAKPSPNPWPAPAAIRGPFPADAGR